MAEHHRIPVAGRVELMAAFHRALRKGRIDEHYIGVILIQFDRDEEDEL